MTTKHRVNEAEEERPLRTAVFCVPSLIRDCLWCQALFRNAREIGARQALPAVKRLFQA
jgi:hypothetical protein